LYEDDIVCEALIIVVETGLDRATVDEVLDYPWREDRIECRVMNLEGDGRGLTGIWRVLEGRERRWGDWGHYSRHKSGGDGPNRQEKGCP